MTTRWQPDATIERLSELILDVVPLEQCELIRVEVHLLDEVGLGSFQVLENLLVRVGIIDEKALEVAGEVLPDDADDEGRLLIDK